MEMAYSCDIIYGRDYAAFLLLGRLFPLGIEVLHTSASSGYRFRFIMLCSVTKSLIDNRQIDM